VIDCLPTAKHFLKPDFDKEKLASLLGRFRAMVVRGCDDRLAEVLDEDLLSNERPRLRTGTIRRLAKWCKTDGIYPELCTRSALRAPVSLG
jgi:hypothetical protein